MESPTTAPMMSVSTSSTLSSCRRLSTGCRRGLDLPGRPAIDLVFAIWVFFHPIATAVRAECFERDTYCAALEIRADDRTLLVEAAERCTTTTERALRRRAAYRQMSDPRQETANFGCGGFESTNRGIPIEDHDGWPFTWPAAFQSRRRSSSTTSSGSLPCR